MFPKGRIGLDAARVRAVELSVRPRPVGPESFLVWGTLPSEEQRPFRKEAAVRSCPPETRELPVNEAYEELLIRLLNGEEPERRCFRQGRCRPI